MAHPLCRIVVSLALSGGLAVSGTLAPEHVHESEGDHPHAFAHRHVQPHERGAHRHDGAEFDHPSDHIVWLDSVGASQAAYQLPMPCCAGVTPFEFVPAVAPWIATPVKDAAPPHGPPRLPQSLRAPPLSAL